MGGLDVRLHAEPVTFPTRHAALLFAYLASDPGTPRLRGQLAALFWGDRGEEQARGSLRQTLFRIRRVFAGVAPPVIEADARSVTVNPAAVQCDAAAILSGDASADAAFDRTFLDGWEGHGADFDQWLAATRRRLAQAAHRFLAAEAMQADTSGDFGTLIDAARRMVSADPYDEAAVRILMTGLALSGSPAAAEDVFRQLVARLQADLETEPSADTAALAAQISARTGRFAARETEASAPEAVALARARDAVRERRQVTFLVCWMAPEMREDAEPEDFLRYRRDLQEPVMTTIARFGGTMDRAPGMICAAWFGWPNALEDAAVRAVRAALAVSGIAGCHVGVATSDMIVEPGLDPVGAAPDEAMALAAACRRGDILVAPTTADLVLPAFELRREGPSGASSVLGPRVAPSRFAARHGRGNVDLVGREAESALLRDRLRRTEQGEGQAILITGESGIGKSHLQEMLAETAQALDARRVLLQCLPTDTAMSFKPVIEHLSIAAGLTGVIDPQTRHARFGAHLEEAGVTAAEDVAALEAMMGLSPDAPADANPADRRRALLSALVSYFTSGGDAWLYYVAIEDVQWADASTLELLSALIDAAPAASLCIVMTARPDFDASLLPDRNLTVLPLAPLSRAEASALVHARSRWADVPPALAASIAEQSDGIPLHVEELVRWWEEQRERQGGDAAVPSSLRGAIEARLVALGSHRRVAQRAACIGRQFSRDALVAACSREARDVDRAIEAMRKARMIFRFGGSSGEDYFFRHALVCDAACESLAEEDRVETHARLYRHFSEGGTKTPEIAAWHAARADMPMEALRIYKACGSRALADFAHEEARSHLENALDQVARLPLTDEAEDERLDIKGRLSLCYAHAYGYGHPDTVRQLDDARRFALSRPKSPYTIPILWQTYSLHFTHADGERARDVGAELLSLSHWNESYGPQIAVGHRFIAAGEMLMGRLVDSERNFAIARRALMDPNAANSLDVMGVDQMVPAGMLHARVLSLLGRVEEGRILIGESLGVALESRQVQSQITAHVLAGQTMLILREWETARRHAQSALDLLERRPGSMWLAYSRCVLGLANMWQSAAGGGEDLYRTGRDELRNSETRASTTFFDALFAGALAVRGQGAESREIFESLDASLSDGIEPWCHAEVMRLDLEAALKTGRHAGSEGTVRVRALKLARAQNADLWVRRILATT
jgi:DNA-binding SARP family transcriptional activator